jgi:2-phospho-L-lactate guanylyltransferase
MITAIVPMKPIALAKRRLSGILPGRERETLVRAMLRDVLTALRASAQVDRRFVVTADPEVAALAMLYGAGHIGEDTPAGLNAAVAMAAQYLENIGAGAMLILPGDVPSVSTAEIDELATLSHPQGMAIVPAHDRDGTNALLLSPPGAIAPSFGPGSFKRHLETGRKAGLAPETCLLDGLGRDIDTPEDLEILLSEKAGQDEYSFLSHALWRNLEGTEQTKERRLA